jgi:SAM-dependent methyltransferase
MTDTIIHHDTEPSGWVRRFVPLAKAGGRVLDLASGSGRNARWLAAHGWQVEAVDRDASALAPLHGVANITTRVADLENEPWPYAGQQFDAIVVCRYLHRPLLPLLARSLTAQGVLIYETFMRGQEGFGRPTNPDFLLWPNELLISFGTELILLAFEQGIVQAPQPAVLQRICMVKSAAQMQLA